MPVAYPLESSSSYFLILLFLFKPLEYLPFLFFFPHILKDVGFNFILSSSMWFSYSPVHNRWFTIIHFFLSWHFCFTIGSETRLRSAPSFKQWLFTHHEHFILKSCETIAINYAPYIIFLKIFFFPHNYKIRQKSQSQIIWYNDSKQATPSLSKKSCWFSRFRPIWDHARRCDLNLPFLKLSFHTFTFFYISCQDYFIGLLEWVCVGLKPTQTQQGHMHAALYLANGVSLLQWCCPKDALKLKSPSWSKVHCYMMGSLHLISPMFCFFLFFLGGEISLIVSENIWLRSYNV